MPLNIRSTIILVALLSIGLFLGLAHMSEADMSDLFSVLGIISKVVSIETGVVIIFMLWAWKWRIFRGWLVPFPNLNGTWIGHIYSNCVDDKTGKKLPPIPTMLTINQSFLYTSCVMHSGEMRSDSYSSTFKINPADQIKKLIYVYKSDPRIALRERSDCHEGTAVFDIIETPKRKLKGTYWTARETTGEIILDFHSKKRLEELPQSLGEHPVTEQENKRA